MRFTSIIALAGAFSLVAAKAQGKFGTGQTGKQAAVNHDQPPTDYGRSHGGKLPHEEVFEEWKAELGEEDHEAKFYRAQEEQFEDLHNRIVALVCLWAHHVKRGEDC